VKLVCTYLGWCCGAVRAARLESLASFVLALHARHLQHKPLTPEWKSLTHPVSRAFEKRNHCPLVENNTPMLLQRVYLGFPSNLAQCIRYPPDPSPDLAQYIRYVP
jgi:hypothetical protein